MEKIKIKVKEKVDNIDIKNEEGLQYLSIKTMCSLTLTGGWGCRPPPHVIEKHGGQWRGGE